MGFEIQVYVIVTKDGKPFHERNMKSFGLEKEQLIDMEQDLADVDKKWQIVSGLK